MQVKELIARLQQFAGDQEVYAGNIYLQHNTAIIKGVLDVVGIVSPVYGNAVLLDCDSDIGEFNDEDEPVDGERDAPC